MNTDELTEAVQRLRGAMHASDALMNALLRAVPTNVIEHLEAGYNEEIGIARAAMQQWQPGAAMTDSFERCARDASSKLDRLVRRPGQ